MKNIFLCLALLGSILIFSQCKKSKSEPEKQTSISYPVTGLNGQNLLKMLDGTQIDQSLEFSLAANLQADASLKIVINNLSTNPLAFWYYDSASKKNWDITAYNTTLKQQTFTSSTGGSLDLNVGFTPGPGKCRIDFFENGSSAVTKSVVLTWN